MRLLPSTSGNILWPILPEGCTSQDPRNCADLRGAIFAPNRSSSWNGLGLYGLTLPEEQPLGYGINAGSFGFENVTFGFPDSTFPAASRQVIAGIATEDFYTGVIGLSSRAVNLTTFTDPYPSLLASLKSQGIIPSLTWGYTAGAYFKQPTAFGSLTLGGYDSSRLIANEASFPFGPDISRDLLLGLGSISSNITNIALLSTEIFVFLDSLVPDLWLPVDTCKGFEDAFGLIYNASNNHYTVNETTRASLLAHNPTVTFKFRSGNGTEPVAITMSYGSFDLSYSIDSSDGNNTRRFPLRQAQNDTQFTLGRAFFQDAYVIADYERSNFSISQAVFPDLSTKTNITAIRPPNLGTSVQQSTKRLSGGTIAGIAVGVICFLVLIAVASLMVWRRRRSATQRKIQEPSELINGSGRSELRTDENKTELRGKFPNDNVVNFGSIRRQEMSASYGVHEMPASVSISELPQAIPEACN